jgi:hypothetical protein
MTNECFTCKTEVDDYSAYCEACVKAQIVEQGGTEEQAFEAYHRFVDGLSR